MNEKISLLNLFFRHEKDSLPLFPSENIADYVPALISFTTGRAVPFNTATKSLLISQGNDSRVLRESVDALRPFVHCEDFERVEKLLHSTRFLRGSQPGDLYSKTFRPERSLPLSPSWGPAPEIG